MTSDEHRERHKVLHRELDELIADFIWHAGGLPSLNTIQDLMHWSYLQTKTPTEVENDEERETTLH